MSGSNGSQLKAVTEEQSVPLIINEEFPTGEEKEPSKVFYEVFFVVMPVFCGYACLFSLQREVKLIYNIADDGSSRSHLYGVAASFVYIGNFVFRLGHNFIFAPFSPRARVIVSMLSMTTAMVIICLIFFVLKHPSLVWVFVAYAAGGIGIGTFESNLLSTIAPLGKDTKLWAILGIPLGIICITVGGFGLLALDINAGWIYLIVSVFNLVGIGIYMIRIYPSVGTGNSVDLADFIHELFAWRHWLPFIKWHSLALMLDMLFVSLFSPGVMLYIYDQEYIEITWFNARIKKDIMFAIFNASFSFGDTISRKIFFTRKVYFPLIFWVFSVIGGALALAHISFLIPLCGFLVAFGNGSLYAQANRQIDQNVHKKYSLIAFSFWLFLGDIGSVVGSNLISYISVDVKKLYH